MDKENAPQDVAIPLKIAETWTKNYREELDFDASKKKVNSYLIPRETLEMVLKLNTNKVRAYVGINDDKLSTLIFVGAELETATGIYRDVFGSQSIIEGEDESPVVYDFSEPSPPHTGDSTSPLN